MLRLLSNRNDRSVEHSMDEVTADTAPIIEDVDDDSDVSLIVVDDASNNITDGATSLSEVDITQSDFQSLDVPELLPVIVEIEPSPGVLPSPPPTGIIVPQPTISELPEPRVEGGRSASVHVHSDSCRRSRRHSSHRRGTSSRRHGRLCRFKRKEGNYLAATCNMVVVVLTCISVVEPRWFYVHGGRCSLRDTQRTGVDYLGIKTFLYQGDSISSVAGNQHNVYYYGDSSQDGLLECVTPNVVFIMKTIAGLCFLVIAFSCIACMMDLFGPTHIVLKAIRCTASLPILSACTCVTVIGLCYLVTQQLTTYYATTRFRESSKVGVEFNVGFYMITAAGAMSVVAVACTLMRVRSSSSRRRWSRATFLEPEQLLVADAERLSRATSACSQHDRSPPPYRP